MEALKELRKAAGLTQKQVADILGVERSTYVKYERGASDPPTATLVTLADLFGVPLDRIVGRTFSAAPGHSLSSLELSLLKKFRALDQRGQASVLAVLDSEYRVVQGDEDNSIPRDA